MDAVLTNTSSDPVFIPGPQLNLAASGDPDGNDVRTWPNVSVEDLDSALVLKQYVLDGTVTVEVTATSEDEASPTQGAMSSWALPKYTVANLPTGYEGRMAFATDGLKSGETAGNGTGVPVYFSNSQWRRPSDDTQVAT